MTLFLFFQASAANTFTVLSSLRGVLPPLSESVSTSTCGRSRSPLTRRDDRRQTERDRRGRLWRAPPRVLYLFRQKTTQRSELQNQTAWTWVTRSTRLTLVNKTLERCLPKTGSFYLSCSELVFRLQLCVFIIHSHVQSVSDNSLILTQDVIARTIDSLNRFLWTTHLCKSLQMKKNRIGWTESQSA